MFPLAENMLSYFHVKVCISSSSKYFLQLKILALPIAKNYTNNH